ncbi:hypothetical protein OIU34_22560 [Pararhizobium sp. BT-229]|uniref:hypothetical protein n=1 Tax=Pararhizobium sp. BT-229 TaxID=2986923 RepID=UPI0021F766F3|nr:hypothetical protein [Pararhizobium sp. BT-229]MCV9964676.1 hypothetical protein [Pararhizobium sp. BT-229]
MQLTVKLPTVFDARLVRHRGIKTVSVHTAFTHEVPEVSASETSVVFETTTDGVCHDARLFAEFPLTIPRGNTEFAIREYRGRLFRKLSDTRSPGEESVDADPFPDLQHLSPIGKPIRLHFEHRHFALARGLIYKTCPPHARHDDPRNETSAEDIAHIVKERDPESFLTCLRMQQRRLESLVCIDGDIWLETSPPCIMVSVPEPHVFANPQDIVIKTALLPEWHDRRITTRYFPLDDLDGAHAYADELAAVSANGKATVTDYRSFMATPSSSAMDFDPDEEFRNRYLTGLALNYGVCLDVMKMDEQARTEHPVAVAFDEALRDNFVTGERADIASVSEGLLAEIDRIGPLTSSQMVTNLRTGRANRLFSEYARRQLDDDIINIIPTRTPR